MTCGAIGENEGWQYGFLAAEFGMAIGYIVFVWGQKQGVYNEVGMGPDVKMEKPIIPGISIKFSRLWPL